MKESSFLPRLVTAPTLIAMLIFVYGFIIWNVVLSFTDSTLLPSYDFVGFKQYVKLFSNSRWYLALSNIAIFASLFVLLTLAFGLGLAILIDQKIRAESLFRSIYLYPMALSFIATGTIWQWLLNPALGLEKLMHDWGFLGFKFDWLINPKMVIYTIVFAAMWQSAGFVMVLFLAGLRGINSEIISAAKIDGASLWRIYFQIIIPALKPVFFSSIIILLHLAIKTFDLVVAMTNAGPGHSSILPSIFMYDYSFTRSQLAFGAASAVIMLCLILLFIIPYLYMQLKESK